MYELIRKAQKGDKDAFVALMEQMKLPLYKAAKAILSGDEDVADALQDTVLAAYQSIPRLRQPKYFKTWLTRILINKCYDIRKKNLVYISSELVPETGYTQDGIENIGHNILEDVAQNYQLVLNLHYNMGFTVKEIANFLNVSESTVKTRLSRGREAVKKAYTQELEASAL